MTMTTTTKLIIALGVVGVGYVAVKQLAPQPKNPVSQVLDSAKGILSLFTGGKSSTTSTATASARTPEEQYDMAQPYTVAKSATGADYTRAQQQQLAPQNTMTRAQAALIGITN